MMCSRHVYLKVIYFSSAPLFHGEPGSLWVERPSAAADLVGRVRAARPGAVPDGPGPGHGQAQAGAAQGSRGVAGAAARAAALVPPERGEVRLMSFNI